MSTGASNNRGQAASTFGQRGASYNRGRSSSSLGQYGAGNDPSLTVPYTSNDNMSTGYTYETHHGWFPNSQQVASSQQIPPQHPAYVPPNAYGTFAYLPQQSQQQQKPPPPPPPQQDL